MDHPVLCCVNNFPWLNHLIYMVPILHFTSVFHRQMTCGSAECGNDVNFYVLHHSGWI